MRNRESRRGIAALLTAALISLCFSPAGAEEPLRPSEFLNRAFSLLEEGNPFLERYNRITGEHVEARMRLGVPFLWSGRDENLLFSREPDYFVYKTFSSSPAYYVAGEKYLYGFDCQGYVSWAWEKAYGQKLDRISALLRRQEGRITGSGTASVRLTDIQDMAIPGDLLAVQHPGRHIGIYAGTLRMYGYTETEVAPELAMFLDYPLILNCTVNAQIADRFEDLIVNGPEKYRKATVTDGGVCMSLVMDRPERIPHSVYQQKQKTRYFILPDGTWLPVLAWDSVRVFSWLENPENHPAPATPTDMEKAPGTDASSPAGEYVRPRDGVSLLAPGLWFPEE